MESSLQCKKLKTIFLLLFLWSLPIATVCSFAEDKAEDKDALSISTSESEGLAEASLKSGLPFVALKQLGEVGPANRTANSFRLAAAAVKQVKDDIATNKLPELTYWPFNDQNVLELLGEVERKNPDLKDELIQIYTWRALRALDEQDAQALAASFDEVVKRRLDPNDENDDLRMNIALRSQTPQMHDFALGRVYELESSGSLGMGRKLRLLTKGFYSGFMPKLLLILLLLIAGTAFYIKFKPQQRTKKRRRSGAGDDRKTRRVEEEHAPGYEQLPSGDDEYSRLLRILGLNDSATEADIKRTYRMLVKSFHPDTAVRSRQDVSSPQAAEQFRYLRDVYERIMEIRRSWFGGR